MNHGFTVSQSLYLSVLIFGPILLLAACVPTPDSYPVPPQRKPVGEGPEIVSFGEYVTSSQPNAESHYIRDIMNLEGASFRWTHAEPELRFFLKSVRNRRFRLHIGVNDVTFRDTGPLKLAILINGQEFDRIEYDSPGDKLYEKPVPPGILREKAENRVIVRVLNPWNSSDPKVKLGFLLHETGFVGP